MSKKVYNTAIIIVEVILRSENHGEDLLIDGKNIRGQF